MSLLLLYGCHILKSQAFFVVDQLDLVAVVVAYEAEEERLVLVVARVGQA